MPQPRFTPAPVVFVVWQQRTFLLLLDVCSVWLLNLCKRASRINVRYAG
jgi:hypothetical protein